MLNPPKTIEEARKRRYHTKGWNPKWKRCYAEGYCAHEVRDLYLIYQCSRKNGHGPSGLYCKQHAKLVEAAQTSEGKGE